MYVGHQISLLSAAELDSSKQYLLQKSRDRDGGDKWYIAYQVRSSRMLLVGSEMNNRVCSC